MPRRLSSRRLRARAAQLTAVALFVVPAAASAAPAPAKCDTQVNDTPSKLVECVQQRDLMAHLQKFQDIANANPGPDGMPSRNSGEPGYKASADYVAQQMTAAGYDVTIQKYQFDYYAYTGVPAFSETSPTAHDYLLSDEWCPGQPLGSATASIVPAGGIVLPPTATSSSTSGCTAGDF